MTYLERQFPDEDFATIKAKADELELRLARAIDPERSRVTAQAVQDEEDTKHLRLIPSSRAVWLTLPLALAFVTASRL